MTILPPTTVKISYKICTSCWKANKISTNLPKINSSSDKTFPLPYPTQQTTVSSLEYLYNVTED
jgi:hypothetical protein